MPFHSQQTSDVRGRGVLHWFRSTVATDRESQLETSGFAEASPLFYERNLQDIEIHGVACSTNSITSPNRTMAAKLRQKFVAKSCLDPLLYLGRSVCRFTIS